MKTVLFLFAIAYSSVTVADEKKKILELVGTKLKEVQLKDLKNNRLYWHHNDWGNTSLGIALKDSTKLRGIDWFYKTVKKHYDEEYERMKKAGNPPKTNPQNPVFVKSNGTIGLHTFTVSEGSILSGSFFGLEGERKKEKYVVRNKYNKEKHSSVLTIEKAPQDATEVIRAYLAFVPDFGIKGGDIAWERVGENNWEMLPSAQRYKDGRFESYTLNTLKDRRYGGIYTYFNESKGYWNDHWLLKNGNEFYYFPVVVNSVVAGSYLDPKADEIAGAKFKLTSDWTKVTGEPVMIVNLGGTYWRYDDARGKWETGQGSRQYGNRHLTPSEIRKLTRPTYGNRGTWSGRTRGRASKYTVFYANIGGERRRVQVTKGSSYAYVSGKGYQSYNRRPGSSYANIGGRYVYVGRPRRR